MVAAALDALVGGDPGDDAVAAALTTIPAAELPDALRLLARQHGVEALPVFGRCLAGRPAWAMAAAAALATLPTPETATLLAAAEATVRTKDARTAIRRALYRLRQAGVSPPAPLPAPHLRTAPPEPRQAWASGIDGTGARGVWLVVERRFGDRTLLSAIVSDTNGVLDFASGPVTRRGLDERLRKLRTESPLPWVEFPPAWAVQLLVEASGRHVETGSPVPGNLARWLVGLPLPELPGFPPVYARIAPETVAADPTLLERSAEVLRLPDLAGWFLDPAAVQAEALELLQAKESRLVVSDQVKAERVAALVDRVIERHFGPDARRRWQRRLEEEAFILFVTDRPAEARLAVAAAQALADPARLARHIPFVRALVEVSLDVAGEVALGRVSAAHVSRTPRAPRPAAP